MVSEPQSGARRYPRSFGGLIGSMIVLLLVVVAYWFVAILPHDETENRPEPVDYLETVRAVQGAGVEIAYPPSLPSGWTAREPQFTPGDRPVWGLPLLTADGTFAGVQQEDAPLADLLDTYVPQGARQGKDARLDSRLSSTWTTWSDGARDHAFATELDGDTLLVYGSASVADLRRLAESLTTAPLR